jgi:calcium-translocating P-type ATPase
MERPEVGHGLFWHAENASDVVDFWESDPTTGLDNEVVHRRQDTWGLNTLGPTKKKPWWQRLLREFVNPLTGVLALAVALTLYLEDYVDAVVISAVILINAVIGFVQEYRAEKAISQVAGMLTPHARVVRDGKRTRIPASELVPGDVVWLESGDGVPADCRLLDARSLECDESALTGESVPVAKSEESVPVDTPLAEQSNMVFAGTLVTRGTASALVVGTAGNTALGSIGSMMRQVARLRTPLTSRLDRLAQQITAVVLVLAVGTFAWGYFATDREMDFLIIAVVGLAVGAIPEGLPAVVTFALAWSARKLAGMGALVRRLPAVEALGSVDVVFTDKTGTLTANEMTVVDVQTPAGRHIVTGVGYHSDGDIAETHPDTSEALDDLLRAVVLCNDSTREIHDNTVKTAGDPTELALLTLAAKAGVNQEDLFEKWPRVEAIPFDSDQQYMVTLHRGVDGDLLAVKGSPERILELCQHTLSEQQLATWHDDSQTMARSGSRVLAAAHARVAPGTGLNGWKGQPLEFLGLLGLLDPPRPDAIRALEQCREAGVHVVMVTGDHPETARAVAGQLGMGDHDVLTGQELDDLTDEELTALLENTTVIARVTPAHKLRLVQLSQHAGHFVAMTGDGVNDAPALRQAHIGVAMGQKGTDVAREAADIVLTDDRFATISKAIREGRRVYDNVKKTLLFLLATNVDEAALIMLAIIFGVALPVTPTQILWINLVTSVSLSFALVFERAEKSVMHRGPNPKSLSLITPRMISRILLVALLSVVAAFVVFQEQLAVGVSVQEAQTAAVTMLVVVEMAILINHRRFTDSALGREGIAGNRVALVVIGLLVVLQSAFVYLPALNLVFDSRPLPVDTWLIIIAVTLAVFFIIEGEKWWRRSRGQHSL